MANGPFGSYSITLALTCSINQTRGLHDLFP